TGVQTCALPICFTGKAEHVITFFQCIAEQVREHLAALGYSTLDEVIGRADLIDTVAAVDHWKAAGLDLAPLLHAVGPTDGVPLRRTTSQDHGLDRALDHELIAAARPARPPGWPARWTTSCTPPPGRRWRPGPPSGPVSRCAT